MWTKQDKQYLQGILQVLRSDMLEDTRGLIAASEHRMITRMDAQFDVFNEKINTVRTEIVHDICDFIDSAILPQLNTRLYPIRKISNKTS
jgi:hypothetical protein